MTSECMWYQNGLNIMDSGNSVSVVLIEVLNIVPMVTNIQTLI